MNLSAYPRTIEYLLSLDRKYIVPRFQREYSWDYPEHSVFWEDLCNQLNFEENSITVSDYFIGALVLVGDEMSDSEFQIVDGQQRLTSISIIFSVLTQKFIELEEKQIAEKCYTYVEGKDLDNKPFFKLVNENPKPFLQNEIQFVDFDKTINIDKKNSPETFEETLLQEAYKFYFDKLSSQYLTSRFGNKYNYLDLLKKIRDQLLKLKTILITVNTLEDAYTIFETLNAKGKDLLTIDLVKNKLFKVLKEEHPSDNAKNLWKTMSENLTNGERKINSSTFLRHYWISKYSFVTESKIYDDFKKRIKDSKKNYSDFLNSLVEASNIYNKIANPSINHWNLLEEKSIYNSIYALKIFDVIQPRPLILSLFDARNRKVLTVNDISATLNNIEKFHFSFSAITSSRASGLEGKYSTLSRKLRDASTKAAARKVIDDLKEYYQSKQPDLSAFNKGFQDLEFLDNKTKDKKLIKYIFSKLEIANYSTDELTTNNLTLEHILPQSKDSFYKGKIGNLLPLSSKINHSVKDDNLDKKIPEFEKSELKLVKNFVSKYCEKSIWSDEDILDRTNDLSKLSFDLCRI